MDRQSEDPAGRSDMPGAFLRWAWPTDVLNWLLLWARGGWLGSGPTIRRGAARDTAQFLRANIPSGYASPPRHHPGQMVAQCKNQDRATSVPQRPVSNCHQRSRLVPSSTQREQDLRTTPLVETMGLEPTTFCVQSRRSSQLSYVPGGVHSARPELSSTARAAWRASGRARRAGPRAQPRCPGSTTPGRRPRPSP